MTIAPTFSVVIPSFNQGRFLGDALESVLRQTGSRFEIIVIDGGSTDSTLDVIRDHSDSIAFWESAPDRGQSHALNKGISRAKGDLITWVNADDILLPEALQRVGRCVGSSEAASEWLVGSFLRVDERLRVISAHWNAGCIESLARRGLASVGCPVAFFGRDLWSRCGGFDETLHLSMDSEWWARLQRAGHRFRAVPAYVYAMRMHEGSKTSGHLSSGALAEAQTRARLAEERRRWSRRLDVPESMSPVERAIHRAYGVLTGANLRSAIDTARWRGRDLSRLPLVTRRGLPPDS